MARKWEEREDFQPKNHLGPVHEQKWADKARSFWAVLVLQGGMEVAHVDE